MIKALFNKLRLILIFGFNYEKKIIFAHDLLIKKKINSKVYLIKEKICNVGHLNSKEICEDDIKFKSSGINIKLSFHTIPND